MVGGSSDASLYVGDLHPAVTDSILFSIFTRVGKVLSARVCRDVSKRSSHGYGFVNFDNHQDAKRAIEQLNYAELMGRPMRIMWSSSDPSVRESGRGNIFIKNLAKTISQRDLYVTFKQFGKILSCKVALDEAGKSKGYAFIHFEDEKCAKKAINATNGKMLNDRIVYVGPFIPKSQREDPTAKPKFNNCYIKNFGNDLDEEGLKKLFEEFGEIKSAHIMKDDQGKSRCFGFVCFSNPDSAEAAVNAMNDKEINGIKIYVSRAQKKAERQELLRQEHEKQQIGRLSQDGVFVKNLDVTIDDVGLKRIFSSYGNVISAKVMLDGNGMSKGFGYVGFSKPEEAREAVNLNGTVVGSKTLYVSLVKCGLDSDKMFLSEQQQRVDYRPNFVTILPNLQNIYGQVPGNTLQLFYPASATMSSHLRLNHGVAGSQIQLGYPRIVPASPYIGGAMPVAMGQSHLTAPCNFINLAFGGPVGAQQLMPNPLTTYMPGISTGMAGGQQYLPQHPYMLSQTPGAGESAPHQATNLTSANITPGPNAQPNEQIQETHATAYPVPAEQTPGAEQHTAASPSLAQHEDSAIDGAEMSGEDKHLTETERQAFGNKIYRKIAKKEPYLASKLTGMILQMNKSFVQKVVDSDAELEQAVKKCKDALAKKKQDQSNAAEGQSSQKKN